MIAGLALATQTMPSWWVAEVEADERMVATVLDLLAERDAAIEKGRRRG